MKLNNKQLSEIKYLNQDSRLQYYEDRETYAYDFIKPYIENLVPKRYHCISQRVFDKMSNYDAQTAIYETVDDKTIKKACIIQELKVRDEHYNELILEEKKLKSLKNKQLEFHQYYNKVHLFYICFTPLGTYIFDLDILNVNIEEREMKKQTFKSNDKENKKITYINIENSFKKIDFILDYSEFHENFFGRNKKKKLIKCIFSQK